MIRTTKVFEKNIRAYNNGDRVIVNQGGTSSAKTWSILILLYLIAKRSKRPLIISVVSHTLPHLKLGAIRDFKNILIDAGENIDAIWNKTDNVFSIGKSSIEFFSTDNLGKVHGPRRDILFVNEANNIKYEIFDHLAIRTRKCIFIDFNPVHEFWVHDTLMPEQPHTFIKSTYLDNDFLDSEIIAQIERKKETNPNWWRVYGMGEIGQFEGAIYTNWSTGAFDESLPYGFGLDFGFRDPDAMSKVAIDRKNRKIYVHECIYGNGMSTGQLADKIAKYVRSSDLIVADAAEARLIYELGQRFNIKPANKRSGSVQEGIKMIQDYELVITPESFNLAKEINNYIWSDKKSQIPEDEYNHLLDGIRYFVSHQLMRTLRKSMITIE